MLIPPGTVPDSLAKRQSSMCACAPCGPRTATMCQMASRAKSPCAARPFSVATGMLRTWNARDFRDGWFRHGRPVPADTGWRLRFRRPGQVHDQVGRREYLSGRDRAGSCWPIRGVREAVIVKQVDARWGEVPAAFIARFDEALDETEVEALCRQALAGYKRPKTGAFHRLRGFPARAPPARSCATRWRRF